MMNSLIAPLQLIIIILLGIRVLNLTEEREKLEKALKEDQKLIFKMVKKIGRLQRQLKEEE